MRVMAYSDVNVNTGPPDAFDLDRSPGVERVQTIGGF
jgi:hypothetical protein